MLSFLVVGLYWINHHRLFAYIKHYDPGLLWLNILFLLCVSFIPFPTAILSEYGDQPLATALYAGTMAATGFVGTLLWWYATRERRLVDEDLDPRLVTYAMLRGVSAATIFLLSIPLAFFRPSVAHYAWLLIPVALNLLSRTYSREEAEGSRRAPAEGE